MPDPDTERTDAMPLPVRHSPDDDRSGDFALPPIPWYARAPRWWWIVLFLGGSTITGIVTLGQTAVGYLARPAIAQEAAAVAAKVDAAQATAESALQAAQAAAEAATATSHAVTAFATAAAEIHGAMICLQIPRAEMPALAKACALPKTRSRQRAEIPLNQPQVLLREWEARRKRR